MGHNNITNTIYRHTVCHKGGASQSIGRARPPAVYNSSHSPALHMASPVGTSWFAVTGGHYYGDDDVEKGLVYATLDVLHKARRFTHLVVGLKTTVELFAIAWAENHHLSILEFESLYYTEQGMGVQRGCISKMCSKLAAEVASGNPALVVAFHCGPKASNFKTHALEAGINVFDVTPSSSRTPGGTVDLIRRPRGKVKRVSIRTSIHTDITQNSADRTQGRVLTRLDFPKAVRHAITLAEDAIGTTRSMQRLRANLILGKRRTPSGLLYTHGFLMPREWRDIYHMVIQQPWYSTGTCRVQQYGYCYSFSDGTVSHTPYNPLPDWTSVVLGRIRSFGISTLEFNHLVITEYVPGEGSTPTTDDTIGFGSETVFVMIGSQSALEFKCKTPKTPYDESTITLYPAIGSIVHMKDDARYLWHYTMPSRTSDIHPGHTHPIPRGICIRLAFRRVIL